MSRRRTPTWGGVRCEIRKGRQLGGSDDLGIKGREHTGGGGQAAVKRGEKMNSV